MKRRIFRKVFAHPFHVPGFLEILEFGTFFRRIDDRGIVFQGRIASREYRDLQNFGNLNSCLEAMLARTLFVNISNL